MEQTYWLIWRDIDWTYKVGALTAEAAEGYRQAGTDVYNTRDAAKAQAAVLQRQIVHVPGFEVRCKACTWEGKTCARGLALAAEHARRPIT